MLQSLARDPARAEPDTPLESLAMEPLYKPEGVEERWQRDPA